MAGIGLYGVYYSKATVADGVVTGYAGVQQMGKAISASFEQTEPNDNPLYANNGIAEKDGHSGSGGTLNLTLDRLSQAAAADLYGLTLKTSNVAVAGTTVVGSGFDYSGDEQSAPVGVAFIRWCQENNDRNKHEVVLFRNVSFSFPKIEAQTMGDQIEWQTPEIVGTVIGKEGDGTNPWFMTRVFPSQAAAIQFITDKFAASAATT
jgi:phi13 family phage major tail protein